VKNNLNVMREKHDAPRRNKDALLGLQNTVKMMLDEESSIQNPHFQLMQERDALISEYKELKVHFNKFTQECSSLKKI
jgi:hypothetical protein